MKKLLETKTIVERRLMRRCRAVETRPTVVSQLPLKIPM